MSRRSSPSTPPITALEVKGDSTPVGEAPDTSLEQLKEEVLPLSGTLASNPDEQRLMHSLLENEEQSIEDGKLMAEAINQGVGSFTPDLLFQNLVSDYRNAERLYGQTLIRALTEYSPDYVKKNLNIPEFKRTLQQRIEENVNALRERGQLDEQGFITERGMKLASLVLYTEELDNLVSKGLGRKELKERDTYGEKEEAVPFKKGFRFKDIAMQQSVKTAIRRGHNRVEMRDLRAYERFHKGRIQVIYAMDSSGSMRGEKIATSKRAGIALSFTAIEERNEVGLIVFTNQIEQAIPPTRDFTLLLKELTSIRAGSETDLAKTILHSTELFDKGTCTKHLLILTDAVPTKGKDPRQETLEAASTAHDRGITISVIGIGLDEEAERLARDIIEVGEGRLYKVHSLENLDRVILEDYDALQ